MPAVEHVTGAAAEFITAQLRAIVGIGMQVEVQADPWRRMRSS